MFKEKQGSIQSKEKFMYISAGLMGVSSALMVIGYSNNLDPFLFSTLASNIVVGTYLIKINLNKVLELRIIEEDLKSRAAWGEFDLKRSSGKIKLGDDGEIEGFINKQENKTPLTLDELLEEK